MGECGEWGEWRPLIVGDIVNKSLMAGTILADMDISLHE